ncbi:hypothetical protein UA08_06030 [Talaromyces atroroseus]|uniref:Uncharacterized protein n=1 Tax=Talaromyces atroroseus TaxID=1441469 RepID=A0A225AW63_TALAT|nr:hypothetical protein UA08_06030 [Talaromyces atroroseus]OKL58675.1 hypothetical protein UA08_06030 [Talaromyces atroroseus]
MNLTIDTKPGVGGGIDINLRPPELPKFPLSSPITEEISSPEHSLSGDSNSGNDNERRSVPKLVGSSSSSSARGGGGSVNPSSDSPLSRNEFERTLYANLSQARQEARLNHIDRDKRRSGIVEKNRRPAGLQLLTSFEKKKIHPVVARDVNDADANSNRNMNRDAKDTGYAFVDLSDLKDMARAREKERSRENMTAADLGHDDHGHDREHYNASSQRDKLRASELSPSDRPIVIGLTVPYSDSTPRGDTVDSASSRTPATPSILVTPAKETPPWHLHKDVDMSTSPEMLHHPRVASSVYSQPSPRLLSNEDIPPVPAIPAFHSIVHHQNNSTDQIFSPQNTSTLHQHQHQQEQRPLSTNTEFEVEDREKTVLSVDENNENENDKKKKKVLHKLSVNTTDANRHRSQGWWTYLLSPLLSRSSTVSSRRTATLLSPGQHSFNPPLSATSYTTLSPPQNGYASTGVSSLNWWDEKKEDLVTMPEKSHFSPDTPEDQDTILSRSAGIWGSNLDDTIDHNEPSASTTRNEATRSVFQTGNVVVPNFDLHGCAAEYYQASAHDLYNKDDPYFECVNHVCSMTSAKRLAEIEACLAAEEEERKKALAESESEAGQGNMGLAVIAVIDPSADSRNPFIALIQDQARVKEVGGGGDDDDDEKDEMGDEKVEKHEEEAHGHADESVKAAPEESKDLIPVDGGDDEEKERAAEPVIERGPASLSSSRTTYEPPNLPAERSVHTPSPPPSYRERSPPPQPEAALEPQPEMPREVPREAPRERASYDREVAPQPEPAPTPTPAQIPVPAPAPAPAPVYVPIPQAPPPQIVYVPMPAPAPASQPMHMPMQEQEPIPTPAPAPDPAPMRMPPTMLVEARGPTSEAKPESETDHRLESEPEPEPEQGEILPQIMPPPRNKLRKAKPPGYGQDLASKSSDKQLPRPVMPSKAPSPTLSAPKNPEESAQELELELELEVEVVNMPSSAKNSSESKPRERGIPRGYEWESAPMARGKSPPRLPGAVYHSSDSSSRFGELGLGREQEHIQTSSRIAPSSSSQSCGREIPREVPRGYEWESAPARGRSPPRSARLPAAMSQDRSQPIPSRAAPRADVLIDLEESESEPHPMPSSNNKLYRSRTREYNFDPAPVSRAKSPSRPARMHSPSFEPRITPVLPDTSRNDAPRDFGELASAREVETEPLSVPASNNESRRLRRREYEAEPAPMTSTTVPPKTEYSSSETLRGFEELTHESESEHVAMPSSTMPTPNDQSRRVRRPEREYEQESAQITRERSSSRPARMHSPQLAPRAAYPSSEASRDFEVSTRQPEQEPISMASQNDQARTLRRREYDMEPAQFSRTRSPPRAASPLPDTSRNDAPRDLDEPAPTPVSRPAPALQATPSFHRPSPFWSRRRNPSPLVSPAPRQDSRGDASEDSDSESVLPPYSAAPSNRDTPRYRAVFPLNHSTRNAQRQQPDSPAPASPGLQQAMTSRGGIPMSEVNQRGIEESNMSHGNPRAVNVHGQNYFREDFDQPRPGNQFVTPAQLRGHERNEARRRRLEKEDNFAKRLGSLWRGRACFPAKGCFGRKGGREKRKRRRWYCAIIAFCLVVIIICVSLATTLTHKGDSTPTQSEWLNLTGFPPMPTGIMTVAGPAPVVERSSCIAPSQAWSCALPKEQQASNAGGYAADYPNFRFEIRFRNGTNTTAGDNSSSANSTASRRSLFSALYRRDGTWDPSPTAPRLVDQIFLGNTTDNITEPFQGEDTPFYITVLSPLDMANSTAAKVKRDDSSTTSATGTASGSSVTGTSSTGTGTSAGTATATATATGTNTGTGTSTSTTSTSSSSSGSDFDVNSIIPAPAMASDGSAAAATLYPLPISQPVKLYNRGLASEHYGFYTYFDKSIFLASNGTVTGDTTDENPNDSNGGSKETDASVRCTWSQTRFLVRIWTQPQNVSHMVLTSSANITTSTTNSFSSTSTSTAAKSTKTASSSASASSSSANDFVSPGSFPYPITITIDRHGGLATKKLAYCYGLEQDTTADSADGDVAGTYYNLTNPKLQNEDRSSGGTIVNPSPDYLVLAEAIEQNVPEDEIKPIDGGTGGCMCEWRNWVDVS